MKLRELRNCSTADQFARELRLSNGYLQVGESETLQEMEWEWLVSRLHGASLQASAEDVEILKKLVTKLGV